MKTNCLQKKCVPLWSLGVAHSANTEQVMAVMRTCLTAQSYQHRTNMSLKFFRENRHLYTSEIFGTFGFPALLILFVRMINGADHFFPYSLSRYVQAYFSNLKT